MNIDEKIWITSKIRIQSERRLKLFEMLSHLIFSYYSCMLIIFAVLSLEQSNINKQYMQIALSVALFTASLISYGFKLGETAQEFRECYLSLDELYNSNISENSKITKYAEILKRYPNHTNYDYIAMIKEAESIGKIISDSSGNKISITKFSRFTFFMKGFCVCSLLLAIVAWPIWALFEIFWPS